MNRPCLGVNLRILGSVARMLTTRPPRATLVCWRLHIPVLIPHCTSQFTYIFLPPPSIGFLTVCHHPILTPPSPLAKVLPCPTGSHISTQYLTHSLLINLTVEAVSTSETSICFCETTQCNIPEGCHLHTCHHLIIRHSATLN
jgi:hypothetical protein